MVAGIVGVPLGTVLAQRLKKRYPRADPIICAFGLLISAPFLLGAMLIVSYSAPAAYAFIFIGSVALNLNWAIVADILLVRYGYWIHTAKFSIHLYIFTHTHKHKNITNLPHFCLVFGAFSFL